MTRKIVGSSNGIKFRDYQKSSSGFITEFSNGEYVIPSLVKVDDDSAFKLYRGNEWLNSVINRIIGDCVKHRPKIVLRDKSKKMMPRHKRAIEFVENFFMDPNPNKESFTILRQKYIKDMLVYGRGSYEKVLDKTTKVLQELYTCTPKDIEIKADKHGNLPDERTYRLKDSRGRDNDQYFNKDEMIYTVFRPVSGSLYGEKPIDAIANAVASDILRASYNANFFVNNAEASGILQLDGMGKRQLQAFKQEWRASHRGASKAHKMVAVNVPIKWVRMALTNRDMEFTQYGKELREKIFSVYCMQPFILGVLEGTSSDRNSDKQIQIYKDGALKPIIQSESEKYTKEILHEGFGMTDYEVIFEGVDLVDVVTQSEIDRSDVDSGILVINEVRGRRGLPDVPWGNTPLSVLPGGNQVDPNTGQIIPPSEQGGNNDNNSDNSDSDEEENKSKTFLSFLYYMRKNVKDFKKKILINETEKEFRELISQDIKKEQMKKEIDKYVNSSFAMLVN